MKNRIRLLVLILAVVSIYSAFAVLNRPAAKGIVNRVQKNDGERAVVLLSDTYLIDRIYQSMQGPFSSDSGIALDANPDTDRPELLWITGFESEVVGENGRKQLSQEFFCHANLTFDSKEWSAEKHNRLFDNKTSLESRLFTLVPGRMNIRLPEGFGVPVYSTEKLDLFSMSLNQNVKNPDINLRFKSHIDFIPEKEIKHPMKAVFLRNLYGYVPVRSSKTGIGEDLPERLCALMPSGVSGHRRLDPGAACAPPVLNASAGGILKDGETTLHWMVPPGRHVYTSDVTEQLKLDFDTTIHYVTAHLHPFGESILVRDKTSGKTIITLKSQDHPGKKQVALMDEFAFPEGIPIKKDDKYELVITYNNPTGKSTDVMGIVYLYLLDKKFEKPAQMQLAKTR